MSEVPTQHVPLNHWRVVALLGLVTGVAYLVRTDVAVAQERMVPALGLTMVTMGAITAWGFQLSYALFQVPAGVFGERYGARTTLALTLIGCSIASLIAATLPNEGATTLLIGSRVILGIAQAAVFPVAAMAVMQYVPAGEQVRAMAVFIATSMLGNAIAPLLMAPVMEHFSWRAVFGLSSVLALVTAVAWYALMPAEAPGKVTTQVGNGMALHELRVLLRDSNLRRLSLAYVMHSAVWFVFVFWFFRYLTEGRGFTILESGVWASLPSIAGIDRSRQSGSGVIADRLGSRIGSARARRRVAIACLLSAAAFVLVGAILPSAILAITALSLSSGVLNGAEAPFFATATAIGGSRAGAAAGILNLMGNLGGVLSIWLVPRMSAAWGWNGTLIFWSGVCVVAALLWLTVDAEQDVIVA